MKYMHLFRVPMYNLFREYTPYTSNHLLLYFRTQRHTENTRSCLCSFLHTPCYTNTNTFRVQLCLNTRSV